MKRTVIAVSVLGLAVSGAGLASAKPGQSNGAQKSGIAAKESMTGCSSAAANEAGKQTANGFAVLNAPGKPGSAPAGRKIVGEVALKNAPANTTYDVNLANGSGCGTKLGSLTVNAQGNGNFAISAPGGAGTYYVTLTQPPALPLLPTVQKYATAPVTLR